MKKHLLLLVITAFCFSCRKRTEIVTCVNTDLYIYTVGADWTDAEAAMAYKYKQDNAFDSLIDSTRISAYPLTGDTSTLALLTPGYDYKLILPAVGKTYLVTHIAQTGQAIKAFTYTQGLSHHEPFVCYNEVASCNINDTLYNAINTDIIYPRDVVCLTK